MNDGLYTHYFSGETITIWIWEVGYKLTMRIRLARGNDNTSHHTVTLTPKHQTALIPGRKVVHLINNNHSQNKHGRS